jgi:hypothetical protein
VNNKFNNKTMKKNKMKIPQPSKKNQEENKKELQNFINDNPPSSFDEIFEMFGDHEYYFMLAMVALYEEGKIESNWDNENEKIEFYAQTKRR